MTFYTIDFESRSEISLPDCGPWAYALHPSTEIFCMAYKIEEEPTKIWITPKFKKLSGIEGDPFPVFQKTDTIEAHNAEFEKAMWECIGQKIYGFPRISETQWYCSAVVAATLALPRSLDGALSAIEAPVKKDAGGRALMLKMCKPREPTKNNPAKWRESPEDLKRLFEYCKNDVDAEFVLSSSIRRYLC